MKRSKIVIDRIYWERVQLYIEGHSENLDILNSTFILRDFTEQNVFAANHVKIEGNKFVCRFNVAILDNGSYLQSGEYLLVNKQGLDYIAEVSEEMVKLTSYSLNQLEQANYDEQLTENSRKNFLLSKYKKIFYNNHNLSGRKYMVTPRISEEVNEFVIEVVFPKKTSINTNIFVVLRKKILKTMRTISFNFRKFIFHGVFQIAKKTRTTKRNRVLFTSDSRGSMSGNLEFVYNEMLRQGLDKKYRISQIFKPNITERRNFFDKFRFPYLLGKSDYIFVDDFHPLLYTVEFQADQEIIQVWHAVGAFKTVGFSRAGKRGGPFFDSLNHRCYTKAYVSSETDIPFYAEAYGIKEEYVIPTGVPRTDVLFNTEYANKIKNQMREEYPFINNKKVILFAPTFRGNGHKTAHYPFFKIDFERFARYCQENNAVVLFKMHPFVKNKLVIPEKYTSYFFDVSNSREVNDILFITDILISDYSSLVYEFSAFKKPMIFYAFDLEDYISTRDFYEPYEDFVPGKIVENFDELMESLEQNDFNQEKVPKFLKKHFKYQDGKSSERLVDHLFKET